jgi:hypothetical protein
VHRLCITVSLLRVNAASLTVDSIGQESGYEPKAFTLNGG